MPVDFTDSTSGNESSNNLSSYIIMYFVKNFWKISQSLHFVVFIAFITVIIKSLSCYRILSIFYDLESEIWLHNTEGIKQNLFWSQMDAIYYLGKKKKNSEVKGFYSISIKLEIIDGIKLSTGEPFYSNAE